MRVDAKVTTVATYFNDKWQVGLIKQLSVSLATAVCTLWVIDNPVSSYQFPENHFDPSSSLNATISSKIININWHWFSPEKDSPGKIRIDYHHHDDILYILNQEHRQPTLTVYDVMKPYIGD